jgi:hypothetical protein
MQNEAHQDTGPCVHGTGHHYSHCGRASASVPQQAHATSGRPAAVLARPANHLGLRLRPNRGAVRILRPETASVLRLKSLRDRPVSDCSSGMRTAKTARQCALHGVSQVQISLRGRCSGLFGADEKTRTSTAFRPQRPQRCASTSSATTAQSFTAGRARQHR